MVGEEDCLSEREILHLKVVEFSTPVKVFAEIDPGASPRLLCDAATVKVFPKHVVLSRPNGAPVAELVLQELNELSEDDAQGTIEFKLRKPKGGESTTVQLICPVADCRSAIYKMVCLKRSVIDADLASNAERL
jgi:hypothetical protein